MALIVATESREFKPLGQRIDYPWESLRDRLVKEFGPDFALFLAEPISNPDLGRVDWYADSGKTSVRAVDLDPAAREELFDRLIGMRQQITDFIERSQRPNRDVDRRFADSLRRVVAVPDDLRFIWSIDGAPCLVAWGMVYIDDMRTEAEVLGEGRLRKLPPPPAAVEASTPVKRRQRMPWMLLLWMLFALLLGVIYFLLLKSCGIRFIPEDSVLSRLLPHACSGAPTDLTEQYRRQALQQRIRNAELELARHEGDCAPPQTAARPAPPPPPPPAPSPEIERRLNRENAQTGKLQISLAWNGFEDLDLYVKCPGGEINFMARTTCGGRFDVDMNSEVQREDAVENAFWNNPPPGQYAISVQLYGRSGKRKRTIPFTIRVKRGDDIKTIDGSVTNENEMQSVFSFTLP